MNIHHKRVFVILFGLIFWQSCHAPYPISEGTKVYVVSDYLHNGILIQRDLTNAMYDYTYYSFIDINYYLEGHTGFPDLWHAIFEESRSAVEVGHSLTNEPIQTIVTRLPYAQIPDGWLFYVSEDNIQKGVDFIYRVILASKGNFITNRSYYEMTFNYYLSERSWTGFYNCAHFSADMLHAMGVSIASGWYTYNNDTFRFQLDQLSERASFTN